MTYSKTWREEYRKSLITRALEKYGKMSAENIQQIIRQEYGEDMTSREVAHMTMTMEHINKAPSGDSYHKSFIYFVEHLANSG